MLPLANNSLPLKIPRFIQIQIGFLSKLVEFVNFVTFTLSVKLNKEFNHDRDSSSLLNSDLVCATRS